MQKAGSDPAFYFFYQILTKKAEKSTKCEIQKGLNVLTKDTLHYIMFKNTYVGVKK